MRTLLLSLFLPFHLFSQTLFLNDTLRFLALGDSYTIGQSVAVNGRWPVQLSDSLAVRGFYTDTMRIIATTGWRTDDLLNAISNQQLEQQHYNMVSLLIGVNNQFQGRPFSQYTQEFPALLDSAIRYAGGNKDHVFIVSIPDYAYTPFGQQSPNPGQISTELDLYNAYNKHVADSLGIAYFDITPISRDGLQTPSFVASDGLHPSAAQYGQWVNLMLSAINHDVIVVGIEAIENKSSLPLIISPNPGNGNYTIAFAAASAKQGYLIEVYDITGRIVLKERSNGDTAFLSLAGYSNGLYTVKINSGNKQAIKKVVKTGE